MAYDQRDFDGISKGVSKPLVLILVLLFGLGGFLAGYYMNGGAEPDPREIIKTMKELDEADSLATVIEDVPVVDTSTETTSRMNKVNSDSIRQKRMMNR